MPVPAERNALQRAEPAIDSNSVILVIGGGLGITAQVCLEWARRYRPTLLIVGRSTNSDADEDPAIAGLQTAQEIRAALIRSMQLNEGTTPAQVEAKVRSLVRARELRRNLQAMRDAGASVRYISVDVRNEPRLRELIESH